MQRIQLRRTKGWRKPEGAIVVSRPSKWGNPYTVKPIGMTEWAVYEWEEFIGKYKSRTTALEKCLEWYRMWAELQVACEPDWLEPLRGKDLACWCKEGELCHADILLSLLEQELTP